MTTEQRLGKDFSGDHSGQLLPKEGLSRAQSMNLDEIDALLETLPAAERHFAQSSIDDETAKVVADTDLLLSNLENAIDTTVKEIQRWSMERKRQEAAVSASDFTLEVLAKDDNPIVKTLALCNPQTPIESLQKAGKSGNPWLQMIAANNSATPPDILAELATAEVDDIRNGVLKNPNASEVTRYKLQDK